MALIGRNEIGSDFALEPDWLDHIVIRTNDSQLEGLFGKPAAFLSTCRSAIELVLDELPYCEEKRALLPGFTCHSVIAPFLRKGYRVFPYPIDISLNTDKQALDKLVNSIKPSIVLFHPYFGFNTLDGLESSIEQYRHLGITIIGDLTQSLFSSYFSFEADYYVGSIRKWLPIPDGAFMSSCSKLDLPEDSELVDLKLHAFTDKGLYLSGGDIEKSAFREEYALAESVLDSRECPYAMSKISKTILGSIDIQYFSIVRRNNYLALVERLNSHPEITVLFPDLPVGVVPFMVPVLVPEGRKDLQSFLASNDVYPTVIWACPKEYEGRLTNSVRTLFDTILCFHCDQRYNISDMNHIGDLLDSYVKS